MFASSGTILKLHSDDIYTDLIYSTSISALEIGCKDFTVDTVDALKTTSLSIFSDSIYSTKLRTSSISTISILSNNITTTTLFSNIINSSSLTTLTLKTNSVSTTSLLSSNINTTSLTALSIFSNKIQASTLNNLVIGSHDAADELSIIHSGKHIFGNTLISPVTNALFDPRVLYPISNTPANINPLQLAKAKHFEETLINKSLFINGKIGIKVADLNNLISGYTGVLGESIAAQTIGDQATIKIDVDAYLRDLDTNTLKVRDLPTTGEVSKILARDTTDPNKVINNKNYLTPGAMITTDNDGYLINTTSSDNPFDTWNKFKLWKELKDSEITTLQNRDNQLDLKDVKELQWDAATQTLKIILKDNSIIQVYIPQVAGPKGDKGDKGEKGDQGPPGESGILLASTAGATAGAASGAAAGTAAGTTAGAAAGEAAANTVVQGLAFDIAQLQVDAAAKTTKDLAQDTAIAATATETTANSAAILTLVASIAVLTGYFASRAGSSASSSNVSQQGTATKPNGSSKFYGTGLQVKGEHLTDGSTTAYSGEIVMSNANYDSGNWNSGDIVMKTGNQNRLSILNTGQVQVGNINDLETEINNKVTSAQLNNTLTNYATITSVSNLSSSFASSTDLSKLNTTLSSVLNVTGINTLLSNYATNTSLSTLSALTLPLTGGSLSGALNIDSTLSVSGNVNVGPRLFGTIPGQPEDGLNNFVIGLDGYASQLARQAISIQGMPSSGAVNKIVLHQPTTSDNPISSFAVPVDSENLCNKEYVDSHDNNLQSQINTKANSSDLSNYYLKTESESKYATQTTVSGIAATLPSLLSISNAASTYATISSVNAINSGLAVTLPSYLTISNANTTFSSYLTTNNAALTYATQSNVSNLINSTLPTYLKSTDANTTLSSKLNLSGGTVTGNVNLSNLSASSVLILDPSKNIVASTITTSQLSFLSGVSSNIQTQLDTKANSSSFGNYVTLSTGSSYLTTTNAASTYATLTQVSSIPLLLTSSTAASTYATLTQVSNINTTIPSLLTSANAASTYATIATVDTKANTSYVDSQDASLQAQIYDKLSIYGGALYGDLGIGSKYIRSTNDPVDDECLSRKYYVDSNDNLRVRKSGDTMTGNLTMGSNYVLCTNNPTANNQLANKSYVDSTSGGRVLKSGDTMTGNLNMGTNFVTCSNDPTDATHLARKNYVDYQVGLKANTTSLLYYLPLTGGTISGTLATNAITCNSILTTQYLSAGDYRTGMKPNQQAASSMGYYFGRYANGGTGWYADLLCLNGWSDGSAGSVNLIAFNKGAKGIRQYQGTSGSASNFSTWYDCVMTDANSSNVTVGGLTSAGNVICSGLMTCGTSDAALTGLNFPNNGIGLNWGQGYSRIVDDGQLRICTDDNMYFNVGCGLFSLGTQKMFLNSSGLTVNGSLGVDSNTTISGTLQTTGNVSFGGAISSGKLNIWNPSSGPVGGQVTHFGWTDNNNYIRGNDTTMDTRLLLSRDLYYYNPPAQVRNGSAGYGALLGFDVITKQITANVIEYYHSGPYNNYWQVDWRGKNRTSQIYKSHQAQCLWITGYATAYLSSAGFMDIQIRLYNQSTGQYFYYSSWIFHNVTYNHTIIPINIDAGALPAGWYDVYTYNVNTGNMICDMNDMLSLTYVLMSNGLTSS